MTSGTGSSELSAWDLICLDRAVELALAAEAAGGRPVGAVVSLGGRIVAEGDNRVPGPPFHPGRHAEAAALAAVDPELWSRAAELTCYTTLEPCLMCFGALVLHGVGRVVYGAADLLGGALGLIPHLPPYVAAKARAVRWQGPALAAVCDPLARRVLAASRDRQTDRDG
jgi:tRNA(adenine34) deaminase